MSDEARDGHPDAYELLDRAWYRALWRLREIVKDKAASSDPNAVAAAKVIFEYGDKFTVLGAPYMPSTSVPDDIEIDDEDD